MKYVQHVRHNLFDNCTEFCNNYYLHKLFEAASAPYSVLALIISYCTYTVFEYHDVTS